MDNNRVKKYTDRLELIERRIIQIREWTEALSPDEFEKNELVKLAVYKAYQEIIEASMYIVAMICKDSGITPKDDYTNLEILSSREMIEKDIATVLAEGNGLRNRIIHRYILIDDKKAFIEITESLSVFEEFIGVVKDWMKKNLVR